MVRSRPEVPDPNRESARNNLSSYNQIRNVDMAKYFVVLFQAESVPTIDPINICGLKAAVFSRKAKLFGVSKSFAICRFARMEVKYTS